MPDIDSHKTAPVGVFGLGNVLMGDDALGPTAIARLQAGFEFPPDIEVEDLGTPGLDLHPHLAGREVLILIDVVKAEGEPGEVRLYRRDDILRHDPGARVGTHDPGVKEALLALRFAGDDPREILLVGVIPGRIDYEIGLSVPVRKALPALEAAVLEELARLGRAVTPRDPRPPAKIWWDNERPQGDRP
ncbi:MAG: hydrogenase maturation protease [Candidatus Krumholzibacteriota bacterium]